ncbi:MAG: M6 family metalloprotease domain-containing protein, partial [Ignavibacteriales bacterium]|nr:M6 family metalloprotease domain-containing protein [Ignavibacteriales bacterium]
MKMLVGIFCFTVLCGSSLFAAPLRYEPQTLRQPDGAIVHCYASGDEYYHWMHDSLGYTIIQNPINGYFVYAQQLKGKIVPTSFIAGKADPVKEGLTPWLKESPEKIRTAYSALSKHLPHDDGTIASLTVGLINNLVIFIRFNNDPEFIDAPSLYDGIFNDSIGTAVSLRNYFYEVSYGALRVTSTFYPVSSAATVISYKDSYDRSYYEPYSVSNPDGYTSDQEGVREGVLLEKALNFVKGQVPSNLDLDLDDDGYVDNVVFIVYGNATGWGDLLSSSRVVKINGAQCDEYNLTTQATAKNGASTFAHEMFHTLGAPDLYHYTDDGNTPVGRWDLMADNKRPPQHMTAYMKYRYGKWISDVPEITRTGTYELNPLVSPTNNCFKIRSPNSATEYFMLEYRKIVGQFEASLSSEGLLIYRINTTVSGGNRNGPPDAVYVFRPNGTHLVYQSTADATFCSEAGRTVFDNSTNPSCFLSDGSKANISISNIGTLGSTISFTVTIDSSFAALTSPGANAQWVVGSPRTIQWVSGGGVDPMRLDYSTDNGATWTVLQGAAVSPFAWTVPNTPSRTCKLRIRSAGFAGIADSVSFAIAPPFHPLLSLFDATAVTGGS